MTLRRFPTLCWSKTWRTSTSSPIFHPPLILCPSSLLGLLSRTRFLACFLCSYSRIQHPASRYRSFVTLKRFLTASDIGNNDTMKAINSFPEPSFLPVSGSLSTHKPHPPTPDEARISDVQELTIFPTFTQHSNLAPKSVTSGPKDVGLGADISFWNNSSNGPKCVAKMHASRESLVRSEATQFRNHREDE